MSLKYCFLCIFEHNLIVIWNNKKMITLSILIFLIKNNRLNYHFCFHIYMINTIAELSEAEEQY